MSSIGLLSLKNIDFKTKPIVINKYKYQDSMSVFLHKSHQN